MKPISEAECKAHWQALVAFACGAGCSDTDANDAVQELFLRMIKNGTYDTLGGYAMEQQRAFLFQRMRWHLLDRWRTNCSMRRGKKFDHVPLEEAHDVPTDDTPDRHLDMVLVLEALKAQGLTEKDFFSDSPTTAAQRQILARRRKKILPQLAALLN